MGKSLYEGSATAKDLYDRAAKVLPFDLRQACFEGPAELLTETRVCQPALYVQGYAIAQILKERGKLNDLKACLGLSLGELTAYAFAGVWDFETGLKVVAERGRLMQLACEQTTGTMASIIGEEAAGAFVAGLRYGEGQLKLKNGMSQKVFWQGPSVGFDFGGNGSRSASGFGFLRFRLPTILRAMASACVSSCAR